MYDVRRTMYDLNASAPEARGNGRRRGKCVWTAQMRCPEGVKTGDGPKQLRGSCSCTMYDFRCTTRTTAVSAYGQRACAAPQGRTGRVVPVSQFAIIARVARDGGGGG